MYAQRVSPHFVWFVGLLLLVIAFFLAVSFGAVSIPMTDIFNALFFLESSTSSMQNNQSDVIVNMIRLPRALLSICVGAILAISGTAMQGLFRNPLADPSLIGVTAGAVAGASTVIVLVSGQFPQFEAGGIWGLSLVSLGAFLGGSITVWLVYRLATSASGTSVSTMLLAGIAITALAGSYTSLLEFSASNQMLRNISLWRMGGLDNANNLRVVIAAVVAIGLLLILPLYAKALNVLLLGESEARHLGIDIERVKYRLIILVALGVGVAVALAGTIAFVGLVVPHIMRLIIGPDHRHLLLLSALAGSILLLLSDTLARVIIAPDQLPVGVVTAALGAPFFVSLLRRRHSYGLH